MTYEKKKCWSVLLRLYHWAFALSIVALVTTGLFINTPWTNTLQYDTWSVTWMRYIHFVSGYVFTAAVLTRIFLYIFGNAQERITDALPITGRNIRNFGRTLLHYSYISSEHDDRLGHNVIAGLTYLVTIIAAVFMMISGFYLLFPETAAWQGWGTAIFSSQQNARFIHHLLMWWFMIFALIHIYLVLWNDLTEPEGLVSSIFTGDKFKHKKV
ncbi:Ni/Fe-hydrogenase, b-type cytochrome subunit [Desulfopila inferna]|uniref:Ni/Fe-hydrogenase, b-type cytochrome subunit n=1 Tax=Desulfopila inferna TaxID=468528 RepID=UPI0019627198|nr:Ni/Fe-hydrogenase, b-type cytochrome subunit [Desulfopila inferna]MBM9606365.1 Ni/Fe-hydrogenase, b-type cytochrome subunit [Desulfopila inferna]